MTTHTSKHRPLITRPKTLKIRFKSQAEFFSEAREHLKAIFEKKEKRPPLTGTCFKSLEHFRKLLTPIRLDVWRIIRDKKPVSIAEAAKLVQRDLKAVQDDV